MGGDAIAARALSACGSGMLTTDLGRTRLVEIMRAGRERHRAAPERETAARAARPDAARATRP